MSNPSDIFSANVFDDRLMQERLPKETYRALKRTREEGRSLDPAVAGVVANAMKDWAIEKGATHYTHWFQPMTGVTAEKHDAFIAPRNDGTLLLEFSGKELVKGETDASSFPSGGIRSTFEARGYTAWDPTSYAFIKEGVLCIPTAYCSYGGQALDKKTPLLRSMQALNQQALRILRLFGNKDAVRVYATVGAEQEYFLVDKDMYKKRPDLVVTGRTLFGAKPPKGQELDDHFFGVIKPRVQAYMKDLNEELWKLGILAKTEHNEAAPAQHEMAPIFSTVNIAADHNQLTMDVMKRVADRHNLVCLLHEKPFEGVNGSGKHNNYALCTNTGVNLLEPGDTPEQNAQFLLFLSAIIASVDDYQDLLRVVVAHAGNDHRLGANEAPPAIMSIFLGDELNAIIESVVNASKYENHAAEQLRLGVHILPKFPKDSTDRNRTSPFAFTGNKFEFRSLGSNQSISGPNVVLNTIIADALMHMADELEQAEDFTTAVDDLIRRTLRKHMRIIFNGNGYDQSWREEAARRGLLELPTTVDALPYYVHQKNLDLFERQKVFTAEEVYSRYEVKLEKYVKVIDIEALSMVDMARQLILPAAIRYSKDISAEAQNKQKLGFDFALKMERSLLNTLDREMNKLYENTFALEKAVADTRSISDMLEKARFTRDRILPVMAELRAAGDTLESMIGKEYWPMPTYQELLMSV
ncbi:MAG: glutamine synthetase type III [Clostridiales bacterium]|nr:glutamine synthetase type III [Clostridiales bacterium]